MVRVPDIDYSRGIDTGSIVPKPEDRDKVRGAAWVNFGATAVEGYFGEVVVPIQRKVLRAAGINLDDPDPETGRVVFQAEVTLEPRTLDDVAPSKFQPIADMTPEDIAAWEGRL